VGEPECLSAILGFVCVQPGGDSGRPDPLGDPGGLNEPLNRSGGRPLNENGAGADGQAEPSGRKGGEGLNDDRRCPPEGSNEDRAVADFFGGPRLDEVSGSVLAGEDELGTQARAEGLAAADLDAARRPC